MSGADLGEWEAFERLHGPILIQERIDVAQAMISASIYRAAGAKEAEAKDFLPRWDGTLDLPGEDELLAKVRSAFDPKG